MSQFLAGEQLSGAIKNLMASQNERCAVAFWGQGAVSKLFGERKMASEPTRIICDISMGCTSPSALEELDAPLNSDLKYIPGLHAKVYISDAGVIIGSANASSNGLGWANGDPADFIEAGTFHDKGSFVWKEADVWFERLYDNAQMIDKAALDRARKLWDARTGRLGPPPPSGPVSLLTLVLQYPERFGNTGFVFTANQNTPDMIEKAKAAAIRDLGPQFEEKVRKWRNDDIFCEWLKTDVDVWPRRFVLFWKPQQDSPLKLFAYDGRLYPVRGDRGDVFADRLDWRVFAKGIGKDHLLTKQQSEDSDKDTGRLIFEKFCVKEGKLFPTATALQKALIELELEPTVANDDGWGA